MPEHTIPNSLVENIRNGRAAIVVGAGIGVPSWKQLLERMNTELRSRGQEGDEAAAKDVDKLLHKGNLVRAAAFLGRQLGEKLCDKVVADTWTTPEDIPEVAKAIAGLPVKQVWTTFPGDLLETAMGKELPEEWPEPAVRTYLEADAVDPKKRTMLKILGDFDSFVATPKSLRRALAGADELRDFIQPYYAEGSLLFVGFRFGDPDLAALLDRVFGAFEPTESDHFLASAAVGPVTVDELESEHHIQVLQLDGKGTDEKATASLLNLLAELKSKCEEEGISLAKSRPEADDLDGWIAILVDDSFDKEALEAVEAIENKAIESEDHERHIEVLMSRAEVESSAPGRATLLRKVSQIFDEKLDDASGAFTALTAALREDPSETAVLAEAEELAGKVNGWEELVADAAAITAELDDAELAAKYYERLGNWYHRKLDHVDYAIASYREAIRRDGKLLAAYKGLGETYRVQQRWGELADLIDRQLELSEDADEKFDLYLSLADLCESQLASTPRAIDAYEHAIALETDVEDAFVALERLFRQSEHWGKLAKVLERKADFLEANGKAAQASAIRRDVSGMRADKLGDLEGSIKKYEAELEKDAQNIEALQSLEDLYDKMGRTEDYLRVLGTLAEVSPDEERPALLRRLAAELEEVEDGRDKAIAALTQLIELDSNAEDGYRSLKRLHQEAGNWEDMVSVLERYAFVEENASRRADIYMEMARVCENELNDPHKAIEALESIISDDPEHGDAMGALARLYRRTEAWQRAADMFAAHAEHQGGAGAAEWAAAGQVAYEKLGDKESARQYLEKALELSAHNLEALTTLANLHRAEGAWESAVNRMADAADASGNRLDKVDLLMEAASICEDKLSKPKRALSLFRKVLEIDPENLEAGRAAAERLIANKEWREALPILEMVARRTDADDRVELASYSAELGRICLKLGELDKAEEHYRRAAEIDPANIEAELALADVLYQSAQAGDDTSRWELVDKRYRAIIARHRTSLADSSAVVLWHRLGVAARCMGDAPKAEAALRRALERDPNHAETLGTLAAVGAERGDWKTVISAKRDLLKTLGEDERGKMLEEIGDLAREHLDDAEVALGAYLEATKLRPESRTLLHKTLDVLSHQKQWRPAVQILGALAKAEEAPKRRAKFHYAAAVICRDELGDVDLAVDCFTKALDDDPSTDKAFSAIDKLMSSKGDWKGLARAYRKMIKSVGDEAPMDLSHRLWSRLGDICIEHLGDADSAIAAYEVAVSIDPSDMQRHEQLANLYLDAGDSRRADAIEELQILIAHSPERVELYKALSSLYMAEGAKDKAYCVSQALVFLKAAGEDERAIYEQFRPKGFVPAKRRLTEELWQKAVMHDKEDRHINVIFSSIIGPVAATTAQPLSSFDFQGRGASDDSSTLSRVFKYANGVLGLAPEPKLYVDVEDAEGLRVANTVENGKLAPTLLAGNNHAAKGDESELAFELGKRMAYFRPERYLNYALQTLPKLETAFYGALEAAGQEVEGEHGNSHEMAETLKKTVPSAVLEQVGAVASKMHIKPGNGVVAGWRSALDLTANRVGLILCNDLATAAKVIAREKDSSSTMSAKERLRDLLAYSVSEEYFAVRRHMGLSIADS